MKRIRNVLIKTFVVFIPVILVWVFLAAFPAVYMDGEYSYYTQCKDYRLGKTDLPASDILILGDSRAKSGLLPKEISDSCFSLAEGGSTAVEAYFTLKDYIEHMGVPKKVILSIGSFHFTSFDGFWTRSVYFDFLSTEQAEEVLRTAADLQETEALSAAGGSSITDLLEYKIKAPTKYMSPLVHSFGENRKKINEEAYREMVVEKGFKSFVSWWPTSVEYDMEQYHTLATLDAFYRKIIDLCTENGIELYSVNTPLIADTFAETKAVREDFSAYLAQLKESYPEDAFPLIHIETELESYDSRYFDDADHLNPDGAARYTAEFKQKYFGKGGAS